MKTTAEQFELPQMPPTVPGRVRREICTYKNYVEECRKRYSGFTLADAKRNWDDYEEHRAAFVAWTQHYKRDPMLKVGEKFHNPDGTLTAMVWVMQNALSEGDRSSLHPCLDFEEHFQRVFIRRGLIQYLTLLLREIEDS